MSISYYKNLLVNYSNLNTNDLYAFGKAVASAPGKAANATKTAVSSAISAATASAAAAKDKAVSVTNAVANNTIVPVANATKAAVVSVVATKEAVKHKAVSVTKAVANKTIVPAGNLLRKAVDVTNQKIVKPVMAYYLTEYLTGRPLNDLVKLSKCPREFDRIVTKQDITKAESVEDGASWKATKIAKATLSGIHTGAYVAAGSAAIAVGASYLTLGNVAWLTSFGVGVSAGAAISVRKGKQAYQKLVNSEKGLFAKRAQKFQDDIFVYYNKMGRTLVKEYEAAAKDKRSDDKQYYAVLARKIQKNMANIEATLEKLPNTKSDFAKLVTKVLHAHCERIVTRQKEFLSSQLEAIQ